MKYVPFRRLRVFLRGDECRMLVRRVVGDKVEDDLDPATVGLGDQLVEVRQRAETGLDRCVVRRVVAMVGRRGKDRGKPDRRPAEVLDVVQSLRDALQRATPDVVQGWLLSKLVAVVIGKAIDKNLIDHRPGKP